MSKYEIKDGSDIQVTIEPNIKKILRKYPNLLKVFIDNPQMNAEGIVIRLDVMERTIYSMIGKLKNWVY